MATKEGEFKRIPLASDLKPATLNEIQKYLRKGKALVLFEKFVKNMEMREPRQNVGKRVATLGSQEEIFALPAIHDVGFFASVLMAYNNHWTLRTSPDDWWFCVIKKVGKAIDENSKKDVVRNFFMDHKGQKTLEVQVNSPSIYGIDYSWFFDEMSKKISQNVKVPGYVDAVTANFSTTTAVHKIASQITLMSSVQEYFDFQCMCGCGIPFVEMLGQENDWEQLLTKAKMLKHQLKPILNEIDLIPEEWWDTVEKVFSNLLATYQGKPHINEWWSHIMSWENAFESGDTSHSAGWTGWIVKFLYPGYRSDTSYFTGGLVTVPLTFVDPMGTKDTAALVAGMLGFILHPAEASLQPFQGWSLLLPKKSPFRGHQVQQRPKRSGCTLL